MAEEPNEDTQNGNKKSMEWFMVSHKKNGGIYVPTTIPQNRNKCTIICLTFLITCLAFFLDMLFYEKIINELEVICYGVLLIFLMEWIYRIILFIEEIRNHFTSRYNNSWIDVIKHVFFFPQTPCFFLILSFIGFVIFVTKNGFIDIKTTNRGSLVLKFFGFLSLKKIMFVESAPIYSSLLMEENNGLNYGAGMAYSFFYGYLKKVLPKGCNKDENLQEKIENYCDSQGVRFSVAKLLILIPKSCTCFPSLMNTRFPNIKESSSLSEKILNVGGVKDRVYKNAVYKIYKPKTGKLVYACVEYASPLNTFKQTFQSSSQHVGYYKKHQEDIVLQFYLTLKSLVKEDNEISELCDLIYYDDKENQDDFRPVDEIILTRIKMLKGSKRKKQE